jgi:hypothetical protein
MQDPKLRKRVNNVLVESLQNLITTWVQFLKVLDQTSEKFGILSVNKVHDGYSDNYRELHQNR